MYMMCKRWLLVWPGDVTQINKYIHIQVNLGISSAAARLTWILTVQNHLPQPRPDSEVSGRPLR